ncbi:MAG: response regulator [Chthoniobacter sp.]
MDDEPANIGALAETLADEGYRVLAAISGQAALKSAAKAMPDLILLDICMPGMDGVETCRRLKSDPRTAALPVLFLTANDSTQSLVEGLKAGGVDYITKPFQVEEVLARIIMHVQLAPASPGVGKAQCRSRRRQYAADRRDEETRKGRGRAAPADEKLSFLSEEEARHWGLSGLIGHSDSFGRLVRDLRRVQKFRGRMSCCTARAAPARN